MEPQLYPFRPWLKINGISPATGYREAAEGKLRLVKLRGRTFIDRTAADEYIQGLSRYVPNVGSAGFKQAGDVVCDKVKDLIREHVK